MLDAAAILAAPSIATRETVTPQRAILYALGVGADDLDFIYECGLKLLPTMATVFAMTRDEWINPAFGLRLSRMLHAETSIMLHAPLPPDGDITGITTSGPIVDKGAGKGALLYRTREIHHISGAHLATVRDGIYLRGAGGFGGSAEGQAVPMPIPDRAPDHVLTLPTATNQAAIYRLSGDMNPLHIDPRAALLAGFDRPILHGFATFGIAGRAVLRMLMDNDPNRLRRIDARFTAPAFPGETVETQIWDASPGCAAFRCRVVERDTIVLDHGRADWI